VEGQSEHYSLSSFETLKRDPQTKELLTNLDEKMLYHNYEKEPSKHTLRVISATSMLSQLEGIHTTEKSNLRIAALYHDVAYPAGVKDHEERGADICGEILDRLQFENDQVQEIQNLIRSTKGEFISGTFITRPESLGQKIICDSDMSLVGEPSEEFLRVGDSLRQELGINNNQDWLKSQMEFLSGLKWHTKSAHKLWEEKRVGHIAYIAKLLNLSY